MSGLHSHAVPDEVEPTDWRLRITGAVSNPLRLEPAALADCPAAAVAEDFACREGWVAEVVRALGSL